MFVSPTPLFFKAMALDQISGFQFLYCVSGGEDKLLHRKERVCSGILVEGSDGRVRLYMPSPTSALGVICSGMKIPSVSRRG